MFRLEGMGTYRVDELEIKSVELGTDWRECVIKEIRSAHWSLASALGKLKIHPLSRRGQMKEP